MSKAMKRSLIAMLAILCMVFLLAGCSQLNTQTAKVTLTFSGVDATYTVEENGSSVTVPDYTAGEGETFLGWATEADKTLEADVLFTAGSSVSYNDVKSLADSDGKLTLYPVISVQSATTDPDTTDPDTTDPDTTDPEEPVVNTVALTIVGDTTITATLTEGETDAADEPEVTLGAKQGFVGWASSENATEVQINPGEITYETASALAVDGALTLYPVIITYDIVLGAVNVKYELTDDDGNVLKTLSDYLAEIKAAFEVDHSDVLVLYRIYEGSVIECGAQINADGDVDVVLAGNNINDADNGNVTLIAKASVTSDWNPGSRYAGLITDSDNALEMYAMLIGSKNVSATVTVKTDSSSDGVTTVVNMALANEAELPEITIPSGKVLAGFATSENAATNEISTSSLTYEAVEAFLTDGAVTLYPVYGDFAVAIWTVNGSSTYVTDSEIGVIKTAVETYLAANIMTAIIRYDTVTGNTSTYPGKIASDVTVVISGSNVESQCGTTGLYKVTNVVLENKNRYVSVYTDKVTTENASLATAFIKALAEQTVTVTIKSSDTDTGVTTVLSYVDGNAADISGITLSTGYSITGWVTTYGDTTAVITGSSVTYANSNSLATDGALTLYPIIESTADLVVAIWAVNGSNTYATDEEIAALNTAFKAYLEQQNIDATVRYDAVSGNTAGYPSNIANDVIIVLSGGSVVSQCGTTGCYEVSNVTFTRTRYASVFTDRVTSFNIDQNLVDMFIDFVAEQTVTVTVKSSDTDTGVTTVLSYVDGNSADISNITVSTGYSITGWTTTYGSTTADISGATLTYDTVNSVATDGAVTLYPIIEFTPDLVVAIWTVNGESTYVTDDEVAALETAFTAYLANLSLTATVRYDKLTGGSSAYTGSIASDAVIVISGPSIASQCGTTGNYLAVTGLFANDKRRVGVLEDRITTANASLVSAFMKFATGEDVTYTPATSDTGTETTTTSTEAALTQSAYTQFVYVTRAYMPETTADKAQNNTYGYIYMAAGQYSALGC